MNTCKQLILYYFSGTGNSRKVAAWIGVVAAERNMPFSIIDISKTKRKEIETPLPGSLIGFCSPTHGFNYPPVMMNFIFRFPGGQHQKVFLVNTRAGMKMGPLYVPGLSGVALLLAAIVLWIKGYAVTGMKSVDLPSNWISLHPGLRTSIVRDLFNRWQGKTTEFAITILNGGKNFRALRSLPLDILISPLAILYYFIGRFVFAKSFYASGECNHCGICIRQCPVNAIRLVDHRPFWSYRCESCMHCMNTCPERAIETAHGYVIGLIFLLNVFAQSYLYIWLLNHNINWFSNSSGWGRLARSIFESVLVIGSLIISYRIVHFLRRLKVIEWLIRYTSLTTYSFWRRYKSGY